MVCVERRAARTFLGGRTVAEAIAAWKVTLPARAACASSQQGKREVEESARARLWKRGR